MIDNAVDTNVVRLRASVRIFLFISSLFLIFTGVVKLASACGDAKILNLADPVFGVRYRYLMVIVGTLEVAVAATCIFKKLTMLSLRLVALLATNFVFYRVGMVLVGSKKPCGCLGSLTDALHISARTADTVSKVLLAYLFIGSCGLMLFSVQKKTSRLRCRADTMP